MNKRWHLASGRFFLRCRRDLLQIIRYDNASLVGRAKFFSLPLFQWRLRAWLVLQGSLSLAPLSGIAVVAVKDFGLYIITPAGT
jgi:hypothetical protein